MVEIEFIKVWAHSFLYLSHIKRSHIGQKDIYRVIQTNCTPFFELIVPALGAKFKEIVMNPE